MPTRAPTNEAAAERFVAAKWKPVGVAAELANDARLVVNMPEALHRKIKLRAVERAITIREYVLELLAADDGFFQILQRLPWVTFAVSFCELSSSPTMVFGRSVPMYIGTNGPKSPERRAGGAEGHQSYYLPGMASLPHPNAQPTRESSPPNQPKGDPRNVRVATDEDVAKSIRRVTRDHRELVKDLAK